jgi:hypothetical protein
MAVFALDDGVGGCPKLLELFSMAVLAVISPLIFGLEILPVFLTGFPIPAIHIAPLMDSEIFWHKQGTSGQNNGHQSQNYAKGPQGMHRERSS